ncbi:jg12155 [Pararge aegeria aegeria]|uniref:Jg12155 protein n=1 Tax=Pararge aegeria aegeria TaxID=348720 RepID=A0A8S4RY49_9NEOP|nr:jg12155 [Pararge aegeria aegeria]
MLYADGDNASSLTGDRNAWNQLLADYACVTNGGRGANERSAVRCEAPWPAPLPPLRALCTDAASTWWKIRRASRERCQNGAIRGTRVSAIH